MSRHTGVRVFRKNEDGSLTEVDYHNERMANAYDAGEVARKYGGGDGDFVADFRNGDVLDFSVKDRKPTGMRHENMRHLPERELPSTLMDVDNPVATDQSIGMFGAFFGENASNNTAYESGGAAVEHAADLDNVDY